MPLVAAVSGNLDSRGNYAENYVRSSPAILPVGKVIN